MALDIKGKQIEQLHDALISAFPTHSYLEQMVLFELSKNLSEIVAPKNLSHVVTELIIWAKQFDKLDELLAGARSRNPTNKKLLRVAVELSLTSDAPPKGGFEARVLQGVPYQNPGSWREKMAVNEQCVCLVEACPGEGIGTGFLVAPNIVITNWHVARLLKSQSRQARLRFNYVANPDGTGNLEGAEYNLAENYLITYSEERELDYALLRVAGEPGNESLGNDGGSSKRGWLTPLAHPFQVNEILLILQHPSADLLKLSAGALSAINNLHQRVTYTANTEAGSSGSPVFTLDWKLVAIHHYGQPSGNLGVPLEAIWAQLKEKNLLQEVNSVQV